MVSLCVYIKSISENVQPTTMPAKYIERPNPPADPSLIPDFVTGLAVQLETKDYLSKDELHAVQLFRRAANYIAAGMQSHLASHWFDVLAQP